MDGLLVTVSPIGIAQSVLPNDGANFGPDTSGSTTNGIQEAVNAVIAAGGGRVFVRPGVYNPPTNYVLIRNATNLILEFDPNAKIQHNLAANTFWAIQSATGVYRYPLFLLSGCSNVRITGGFFYDVGVNGASPFYREVFYIGDSCTNVEIDHAYSTGILGFFIRIEGQWMDKNNQSLKGSGPVHAFIEHHNTGVGNGFNPITQPGAPGTDGGGVRVSNSTGAQTGTPVVIDEIDLGEGDYWGYSSQSGPSSGLFVGLAAYDLLGSTVQPQGPIRRVKIHEAMIDMGVFPSNSVNQLGQPVGILFEPTFAAVYDPKFTPTGAVEIWAVHVKGGYRGIQISVSWADISIADCIFEYSWQMGVSVQIGTLVGGLSVSRVTFSGCGSYNNNQQSATIGNTRAGFVIGTQSTEAPGAISFVSLVGCDASDNQLSSVGVPAPTQSVGFIVCSSVPGGSVQHVLLDGCRGQGNVTGPPLGVLVVTSIGGAVLSDIQTREVQNYNPFGYSVGVIGVAATVPNAFTFRVRIAILTVTGTPTATITDPNGTISAAFPIFAGQQIELDPGASINLSATTLTWQWYGK